MSLNQKGRASQPQFFGDPLVHSQQPSFAWRSNYRTTRMSQKVCHTFVSFSVRHQPILIRFGTEDPENTCCNAYILSTSPENCNYTTLWNKQVVFQSRLQHYDDVRNGKNSLDFYDDSDDDAEPECITGIFCHRDIRQCWMYWKRVRRHWLRFPVSGQATER